MGGEGPDRLPKAAGNFDRTVRRIAIAGGVRPEVDHRVCKICRRRRESWVIMIVTAAHGDKIRIEQLVSARIIRRKLLGIVGASHPPGEAKMQAWTKPV